MSYQFDSFKGVFAIVLASFLWGTTGTASSFSVGVSPLAIGAFSTGSAGILLVFTAQKKLFRDSQSLFSHLKFVLLGAVSIAIYPLTFYSSMSLSGVAIGTVVSIATAPFFTALLERIISKKHISVQWGVSFVIGSVGIVFLVLGKEQNSEVIINAFWQNLGVALGVLAGLSYALYSWVARDLIEKGIHSQSAMSGMFGCAALLLLPSLWFTGGNLFSNFTNTFVSLYMAVIPMYLGYVLFAFGLKWVDASKATLITLIEPLVAAILAVLIIGESFKPMGWLGMALVFLCLLIQTWPFKTRV